MFKNLLRKGGNDTPRNLSNPSNTGNIFASQEEQILTAFRNIPALWEVIEDQKFHEQHQDEDLEEIKQPWETFDGEKTLEPEIEEFLPCLSSYPL
jgi:hypothetical protein